MTERQKREMGRRVARLRDAQGMTNEALARKSGLSVKTVSRFINGRHEARTNTIEAIAKALKVPERDIRGAPPEPFAKPDEQLAEISEKLDKVIAFLGLDGAAQQQTTIQDLLVAMVKQAAAESQPSGRRARS